MKLTNQIKLELENFDKCHAVCDMDCPLGQLYDYSCTLQRFVVGKIKENEPKSDPSPEIEPEKE